MSKSDHQSVNVDVPPARASAPRFQKSRMAFRGLVFILVGLGVWKAYELIVTLLTMYNEHKGTVHVVAVLIATTLVVLGLWLMVRARRADADAQQVRASMNGPHAQKTTQEPADTKDHTPASDENAMP